jgi:hypothetical protein
MTTEIASPPEGGQGAEGANQVSPPAAPAEGATPPSPFYASLKDPALRGYAEVKGYKHSDPIEFSEALLKSYQNLEKLRGVPAERLLTLPENMEDAEALKPIMAKLGLAAPEKAEDYGFTAIEGMDQEFATTAQGWMHELGVPPKIAAGLAERWQAFANAQREGVLQEATEETAAELGRLQGEWGPKYDENVEIARRAVRQFGFSESELQSLETSVGAAAMYKRFQAIGMRLNEGSFIEGANKKDGFVMTPDAARSERTRLTNDKDFMAKYLNGDAPATEKIERLNRIIAGAQAKGVA